ncbi:MAG: UDP-N-acetylglucosamine 1-carboxyvinyltransferase [Erysipelotrichaceae bacterium]|nr:UDP-N-acetylglucosamine 1-carboxyvinyltransferase [Erysipelotrichaceae bacterium]MDY5252792.1 UDP-N-acetylglucosamine 1-carboxyvinyltransferase [Erysipelotrichaceae bacterium]
MEEIFRVEGGYLLNGEVRVSGAKNATVALIPAAILANGPVAIVGVPQIADVDNLADILKELNVQVTKVAEDHLIIDPTKMQNTTLDSAAVTKLRASYYFMGALLGKYGYVKIKMPGGCYLGPRPIDLHLKGFEALGANVVYDKGCYTISADTLIGNKIFLDIASVGATINIMMAAVYAKGRTVIENAAKEPEIIDIATLLNKMGAQVRGAGTNVITIDGTDNLMGCFHEIIPDRIEAGTFIVMAAAMAKKVRVTNIIPAHLEALLSKLEEMGVKMDVDIDSVTIYHSPDLKPIDIKTAPYPGFATDLQQPLTPLMCKCQGQSSIKETIYPERFKHCVELQRMGADIDIRTGAALINGPTSLFGDDVVATDLRCGASLIIAGLMAEGVTNIHEIYHIDRGYANIDAKLRSLGAHIDRVTIDE